MLSCASNLYNIHFSCVFVSNVILYINLEHEGTIVHTFVLQTPADRPVTYINTDKLEILLKHNHPSSERRWILCKYIYTKAI